MSDKHHRWFWLSMGGPQERMEKGICLDCLLVASNIYAGEARLFKFRHEGAWRYDRGGCEPRLYRESTPGRVASIAFRDELNRDPKGLLAERIAKLKREIHRRRNAPLIIWRNRRSELKAACYGKA